MQRLGLIDKDMDQVNSVLIERTAAAPELNVARLTWKLLKSTCGTVTSLPKLCHMSGSPGKNL